MNLSKITIHSDINGIVIMTPANFYKISDHDVKYVVIYNLKFINGDQEIESQIPYYISNGATNKLRANMLYPFMCYSSINEVENCPYDESRRTRRNPYTGLLLKYNMESNINIDKLEEDLLKTFLGIYSNLHEEKSKISTKIRNKHTQGDDLISVLQRITNLLDFIICITNDVIRDFNYAEEQIDIDNGKYSPLSREQKYTEDYTDLSIFGQETIYNINHYLTDDSSSSFNNHFRLVILTILNKYYKLFVDNNIFNIETVVLQPEIITITIFNRIVNICEKETAKVNMKNYKIISNKMIDVVTEKIDTTETSSEQAKMILKSVLIRRQVPITNDDEMYNYLLTNWNAQCLSKGVTIHTTNVYTMNVEEICQELTTYLNLLGDTETIPEINRICDDNESASNLQLKILRDRLLMVRSKIIFFYYIGQLQIKYITSGRTEKTVTVDVDSSETISILKSKIYSIIGIEPNKQHIMIHNTLGSIIHLDNDRTIASYKIPNKSLLKLSIKSDD
jgi:hypothetical protein